MRRAAPIIALLLIVPLFAVAEFTHPNFVDNGAWVGESAILTHPDMHGNLMARGESLGGSAWKVVAYNVATGEQVLDGPDTYPDGYLGTSVHTDGDAWTIGVMGQTGPASGTLKVYTSLDAGETWATHNLGSPNAQYFSDLEIFTTGGGKNLHVIDVVNQLNYRHSSDYGGNWSTGFGHTLGNLVPSCRDCNSSKGNKPWREWIETWPKMTTEQQKLIHCYASELTPRQKLFSDWESEFPEQMAEIRGHWDAVLDHMKKADAVVEEMRHQFT
jgi:hypothetical protein